MTIKHRIVDGQGTGYEAHVFNTGALKVAPTPAPIPEIGTANTLQYFQGVLGSTGLNSGNTNQSVNGATTPQSFYIESNTGYDIHIMQITTIIADTTVVHNDFGGVSPLTVGWDLKLTESGVETFIINKAKTGGQALAQSGFGTTFGDAATMNELINWTGGEDATIVTVPIRNFIPGGLRLGRGSTDKLESIINDDLTGLTEMYVYAYGYKHLPSE